MKLLTMRDLNRRTAEVLDAIEHGETFELRRRGRAVGYLVGTLPSTEQSAGWESHFEWLTRQRESDGGFVAELDAQRRRQRAREENLS
ncbi:MAG: hypothetical protein KDM81_02920 [Verrucomicrobiae bacterium]|nr:hypothetical protein [Verrucomicrobiae bacterium]MCP5523931.1 hypothetical protein [Verrucomicrobiales bacterium]